jgi:hypothetical protein
MDLEETEARNDCAGEGQQQFNRLTDPVFKGLTVLSDNKKSQRALI